MFTATSRAEPCKAALDRVFRGATRRAYRANSLRLRGTRSRIRSDGESRRESGQRGQSRCRHPSPQPSPTRGEGAIDSRLTPTWRRLSNSSPRVGCFERATNHRNTKGALPPPLWGRVGERGSSERAVPGEPRLLQASLHCVFATRGGVAVVTNCVASSMAWPNGVGSVMRNGTITRVPAIGTKAISMFRWAARYLMIGRSGM
jgi:hypothetical protein